MGTDIYCAIERHDGERWRAMGPLEIGRNRHLFRVLALGDHPIAAPRGLPGDGDPDSDPDPDTGLPEIGIDQADYRDRFGDHSKSYLMLSELRGYDWDRVLDDEDTTGNIPLRYRDLSSFDREIFEIGRGDAKWEPFGNWAPTPPHRPDFYYTGNDPSGDVIFVDDAAARLLLDRQPADNRRIWVRVRWRETIGERCADFLRWLRSQDDFDGDRTRILFGFDS